MVNSFIGALVKMSENKIFWKTFVYRAIVKYKGNAEFLKMANKYVGNVP